MLYFLDTSSPNIIPFSALVHESQLLSLWLLSASSAAKHLWAQRSQQRITMTDTDASAPSRLLTLPPELRNRIYAFALPLGTNEKQVFRFSFTAYAAVPALLRINCQVRSETLGLYYGTAYFEFIVHHRGFWQLEPWVDELAHGAVKHLLQNKNVNVRIVFDAYHKDFDKMEVHLCDWAARWGKPEWWLIAEPFCLERRAVEMMYDIEERKKWEVKKEEKDNGLLKAGKAGKAGKGREREEERERERPEGRVLLRREMERMMGGVVDVFHVRLIRETGQAY